MQLECQNVGKVNTQVSGSFRSAAGKFYLHQAEVAVSCPNSFRLLDPMSALALRPVAIVSAGQRKENDQADEGLDREDKDAAFGPGNSAAEDGPAYRVGGEEMVLHHGSAVGDAVEEGLGPVP